MVKACKLERPGPSFLQNSTIAAVGCAALLLNINICMVAGGEEWHTCHRSVPGSISHMSSVLAPYDGQQTCTTEQLLANAAADRAAVRRGGE